MGPAFSEAENRARLERCRVELRNAGLDGCICVAPEHLYYVGGYDAHTHFSQQALIFSAGEDEPTLLLRDVDEPLAEETSWIKDVRLYHFGKDDPALMAAEIVREKGLSSARIGADLQAYSMPGSYALKLIEALKPSTVVDSTDLIGKLRCVKSPSELAYIRDASRYARLGMRAVAAHAKPGITEIELAAEIDYAMRSAGSDYPAMPTWIASGTRTAGGHALPTDRVLKEGDLIHVECAGVTRRYHCVTMQTFSLGQPSARVREICDASRESLLAGMAEIRVGAPVSAAEIASLRPMDKYGLRQYALMRFGLGISAAYPPCWLEPLNIIAESNDIFQSGMVFYLHSCLEIAKEGLGTLMGGAFALSEAGMEQLDEAKPELVVL